MVSLQNDIWSPLADMTIARMLVGAALIGETKLWITGGYSPGGRLQSTETLETGNSQFIADINLPEIMEFHVMTAVNESAIIILCWNPISNRVYMFDVEAETFTALPQMTQARMTCGAGMFTFSHQKHT